MIPRQPTHHGRLSDPPPPESTAVIPPPNGTDRAHLRIDPDRMRESMHYDKHVTYQGKSTITVQYAKILDGGGSSFGQQFLEAVALTTGHTSHVFEFCAGPGFIGFSLL